MRRRRIWGFDARYRRKIPASEICKEFKRIEPVDSDLAKARFAPPPDVLLYSGSELFWGSGEKGPVRGSFEALFPDFLARAVRETGIPFAPPAGLFGNVEETAEAGLSDLSRITERDLVEGTEALRRWRDIFVAFYSMVATENPVQSLALAIVGDSPEVPRALEKVMRSLDQHEWRVATLAWMVVAALRKREAGGDGCAR
jgi:hypothetical protein